VVQGAWLALCISDMAHQGLARFRGWLVFAWWFSATLASVIGFFADDAAGEIDKTTTITSLPKDTETESLEKQITEPRVDSRFKAQHP